MIWWPNPAIAFTWLSSGPFDAWCMRPTAAAPTVRSEGFPSRSFKLRFSFILPSPPGLLPPCSSPAMTLSAGGRSVTSCALGSQKSFSSICLNLHHPLSLQTTQVCHPTEYPAREGRHLLKSAEFHVVHESGHLAFDFLPN